MVEWFNKLSREKKDFFILAFIELFVFLCLLPLMFFDAGSWPLGWLVGGVATLLNYYLLVRFSAAIFDSNNGTKNSATILGLCSSFLRYFIFAALIVLSAICTFKSEWLGGFSAFNVFAVALSYFPLPILILTSHFLSAKKEEKMSIAKKNNEKNNNGEGEK